MNWPYVVNRVKVANHQNFDPYGGKSNNNPYMLQYPLPYYFGSPLRMQKLFLHYLPSKKPETFPMAEEHKFRFEDILPFDPQTSFPQSLNYIEAGPKCSRPNTIFLRGACRTCVDVRVEMTNHQNFRSDSGFVSAIEPARWCSQPNKKFIHGACRPVVAYRQIQL
ncbi:hypothetical protein QAD02_005081 [Eretmocerus hayati]|uniref:Uncharacterized protein n=1 Tax=Eretmocerus hayati TaxID=131215 RepID=A0ACC2NU20_9HYME|nr:hypothetical protein QAD02_005081 [Eretmocerus hayati]